MFLIVLIIKEKWNLRKNGILIKNIIQIYEKCSNNNNKKITFIFVAQRYIYIGYHLHTVHE